MKDLELNWLSGMFLGWCLASFVLMFVFFTSNFHRWFCAGSFGAGIVALLTWSFVKQIQAKSETDLIKDAVNKVLK